MAVISEVEIYKQFGSMLDKPGLRLKQVKEYMREVMESIMRESGSVIWEGEVEKGMYMKKAVPFVCVYPENQFVGEYRFRHISGGLYRAEPKFVIREEDLAGLLAEYTEIQLSAEKMDDGLYQVVYGFAPEFSQLYITDVSAWKELGDRTARLMRHKKRFLEVRSLGYNDFLTEQEKKDEKELLENKHQKRHPQKRAFEWEIPEKKDGEWIFLGSVIGEKIEEGIYAIRDPGRYDFGSVCYFYEGMELSEVCCDGLAGEHGVWALCSVHMDYERAPWLREKEWQCLAELIAIGEENLPKLKKYLGNFSGKYDEVIKIV